MPDKKPCPARHLGCSSWGAGHMGPYRRPPSQPALITFAQQLSQLSDHLMQPWWTVTGEIRRSGGTEVWVSEDRGQVVRAVWGFDEVSPRAGWGVGSNLLQARPAQLLVTQLAACSCHQEPGGYSTHMGCTGPRELTSLPACSALYPALDPHWFVQSPTCLLQWCPLSTAPAVPRNSTPRCLSGTCWKSDATEMTLSPISLEPQTWNHLLFWLLLQPQRKQPQELEAEESFS